MKFKTFENIEINKFKSVWNMKEEEIMEQVKKVLEADKIIHEHQLGLDWVPPNKNAFKFEVKGYGSVVEDLRSTLDSSTKGEEVEEDRDLEEDVKEMIDSGHYHIALNMIFKEAEILLSKKTKKMIDEIEEDQKTYIKSQEILKVLNIRDKATFEALMEALCKNSDIEYRAEGLVHNEKEENSMI